MIINRVKLASLLLLISITTAHAQNQRGGHGGAHHGGGHAFNNAQFRNNVAPTISSSNYRVNNPNVPNHFNQNSGNYNSNSYNRNSYNRNNYNNNHHYNNQNGYYGTYFVYPDAYYYPVPVPVAVPEDDDDVSGDYPSAAAPVPAESWVNASNGVVPANAVAYASASDSDDETGDNAADNYATNNEPINPHPTFYCRALSNNQYVEGVLVPNDGCYVQNAEEQSTTRFQNYQVLVNNTPVQQ